MIFKENVVITFCSLILGLVTGTVFSKIFFLIIIKISGIEVVDFQLHLWNYLLTSIVFGMIFIMVAIYGFFKLGKLQIVNSTYHKNIEYCKKTRHAIISVIGLLILAQVMYQGHNAVNTNKGGYGFGLIGILGLYLFIYGIDSLIPLVVGFFNIGHGDNPILGYQIKQVMSRNKSIMFLLTMLGILTFYISGSILYSKNESNSASIKSDLIVFEDLNSANNIKNLEEAIKDSGGQIKESRQDITFNMNVEKRINKGGTLKINGKIVILSESIIEELVGISIDLKDKQSLMITNITKAKQIRIGREDSIILKEGENAFELSLLSAHAPFVLADNKATPDYLIIVSAAAYDSILKIASEDSKRIIQSITLQDRNRASDIVQSIKSKNVIDWDKVISRSDMDAIRQNELRLSRFLFLFTQVLLFLISGFILYFNISMDIETMKALNRQLLRIGVTGEELKKITLIPVKITFFLPWILSVFIKMLDKAISILIESNNAGINFKTIAASPLLIYLGFCTIFYFIAKSRVCREAL
jgi:hypothetical protein